MRQFMEWSLDDIEKMKVAFLSGQKIKEIARDLKRTPTALNKALSRFGIRSHNQGALVAPPNTESRGYIRWAECKSYFKSPLIDDGESVAEPFVRAIVDDSTTTARRSRDKKTDDNRRWVHLDRVMIYLANKGYQIDTLPPPHSANYSNFGKSFMVNRKPISNLELLLLANRHRNEEKKPTFLVSEVTW
ncbi:MAG: hypothetical protein NTX76_02945 [Alphaproteobacteria bacterium]|nr:hypothetical protein [Alphaproteobacteria bacterium]